MKRSLHAGKRQSGGFGLNLFSDDELHEIHLATLEVLQHTGIFVENEEALAIFDGGGARIDKDKKMPSCRLIWWKIACVRHRRNSSWQAVVPKTIMWWKAIGWGSPTSGKAS